MNKSCLPAFAFALSMAAAAPAMAWDPDPIRGEGNYTGVARFLDVSMVNGETYLAFSGDPGAFCTSQGGSNGGLGPFHGGAWLYLRNLGDPVISRWLSALMWAKAQNFQVRLFITVARGQMCELTGIRTCSDAAACAYPPAPAP